jgi:hypothetical protein
MENQYLDSNLDQEKAVYSGYGSFLRRFAAALIDGILLAVVNQLLQSVTGVGTRMQEHLADDPTDMSGLISIAGPIWAVGFAVQLVYYAYFESSKNLIGAYYRYRLFDAAFYGEKTSVARYDCGNLGLQKVSK